MSTTTQEKWGYYPCDRETCQFLKKAHKLLLRAYCDCKRWIKWEAKMEHNRKEPEPIAPTYLVENGIHIMGRNKNGNYNLRYGNGFLRTSTKRNYYLAVLEQYQNARRPKDNPEDVVPIDLPSDLGDVIKKLEGFYG